MYDGARDYRRLRAHQEEEEELLLRPPPGKRSLVEKIYGQAPSAAAEQPLVPVTEAEHPFVRQAEAEAQPRRERPPVPAAQPPLLPLEVGQYVQAARQAERPARYVQAAQPADPAPPVRAPAPAPAAAVAPAPAAKAPAAVHGAPVRLLEDFEAAQGEPAAEYEEEAEIPEDLEELDEEELDEVAEDLELDLPADATVEQKRKAIEAARAARQGKALKGVAGQVKKVAAAAAADQAGIEKRGKASAAGRAAQGKAAGGAAKAVNLKRSFARAKNIDELKARLRKVMEEDKARFDEQLKKDSEGLAKKMQGERDKLADELKALDKKLADEIAAREKEIAGQIQHKLAEAKSRAEADRAQAQATSESEKRRRRDQAAAEARRIESEGGTPQAVAEARGRGEQAAHELDGKLAATLDRIARAEQEGVAGLAAEKEKMLADARARAKAAGEEGRARHDAAVVKMSEQERTGLEKLKAASDALRKGAVEKFDAQMKKLESGKAEDLAALEAESNKIIAEIDQEVLRFQATAQAVTRAAVQAAARSAQVAIDGIKQEGKQAAEAIDDLARQAMARIDQQAAEMAARQAAVADEGQRRLTAETPEEAAQVEREAEAREKAEADKVKAEAEAKRAESEKIDQAAAEIADELDDTFVDEDAVLNHMRGKTPEQIAAIKQAYFIKTGSGRQLDADLVKADALDDKEMKEAKAHLSGDPVQRAVATLENAEDGWTGEEDEARIKATLAGLDPETRKKVAAEYEKQTGRRLNAMLADELDDEDCKDAYVGEDPKKKVAVSPETKNSPAVHAAVSAIFGATADDDLGTNEKAVYQALKGKSPEEIEAIKQVWLEKHGPPGLDAVLEDEMSGTELKNAKALMSDDPVQKAVASLENASDGVGTDKATLQATLESIKDPALRAQVAAEYEKQTGQPLDLMLVDELSGRDLDKAQAAATGDVAALRAIEFDEAKNSSVIGDLAASASDVLAEFGIEVDPDTISMIADIAMVVALGPVGLILGAALLAEEHIDLHDDENAMYAALEECKTPEERKAMEEAFNQRYAPKTLRGEIADLDDAEVDVATALLDGDKTKARAAKMKAGSEQLGWADKDLMFQALEECESVEERDALIAEYNRRYGAAAGGVDYDAMLNEEFKYNDLDREKAKQLTEDGKVDQAFALFYAQHAGLWGTSGTGLGTDEEAIAKILKGKSKEEIAELKKKYAALAGKYDREPDLEKSLDEETSGRTGKQVEMLMRGEPTTAAEALARQEEMAEFEREDTSGWAIDAVALFLLGPINAPIWLIARLAGVDTDEMSKDAVDCWNDSAEQLEASQLRLKGKLAELERTMQKKPGESDADFEKRKLEAFKVELEKEEGYLENYQENKDATADAASTATSLVVTGALSIATGGAAAWACALIGGLAGIGAKAAILGGAYELEDFGMDLVEVAAEAIAAGVAKGADLDRAAEGLKALGVTNRMVTVILKEALEEAIENGTSELILALFNEDNYKSLEAFLFGVGRAVGQAALSGAVAAGVTILLGDMIEKQLGARAKKLFWSALKEGVSEGIGGLAAAAIDPATWEGDMEAVFSRFGKGFIDNILSAGAEGIGEAAGHAMHHGRVKATQQHLADHGVGNTAVVSGHVLDLDSGRVFDGETGAELGRIHVDPETGMVTDVTDPAHPVPLGVNQDLRGQRVGGVDSNAQAGGLAGPDADLDPDGDRPTVELRPGPDQGQIDEATARQEEAARQAHEAASVEKARAVLASMTGEVRPGRSLEVATAIATELMARAGVAAELVSSGDHHFLRIGDTIIDGSLHAFFAVPDGFAPAVFIGRPDALKAVLASLERNVGLAPDLAGLTVAELFAGVWGSASPTGAVLDLRPGAPGTVTGSFQSAVDAAGDVRDAAAVASDFPVLAAIASLDPDIGFGDHQQARAAAALAAMSAADYVKMRSMVNAQQGDVARAYLLKALAAGNSLGEIERFAGTIHGQSNGWLIANLSLADPLGLANGGGIPQQSKDSCNAAMLIAMMGDLDPILALRVRENPDTIELVARLERLMLETRYQGDNPSAQEGDKGVGVPRDFADGKGRGRFIDDFLNAQSKWTGISFTSEMNPTAPRVIAVLDQSLAAGMDVPVVVGPKAGVFAHYVLVTGRRVNDAGAVEYRFFDPATGTTRWIAAADVSGGRLAIGGFDLVTGMEVPASPTTDASDADATADTERTPAADAAPDSEPMPPGTGATGDIEAVMNGAGAMTARVRQMLNRMSPAGLGALERIAGHALGDGARIRGLVEWVQHTTKHTRKLVGDELARRMGDAEAELRTVLRLLAEAPDSAIFMNGDRTAAQGASGKQKSSDLRVVGADGSERRVETTRMATPLAAVEQLDKPFTHGLKEDDLPPEVRREVSIEVELDPAAPATLLDEVAAHLDTIPDNQKLDRVTLFDAAGRVVADFARDPSGWAQVAR